MVPGACDEEEQVVEWRAHSGSWPRRGPHGGLERPAQEKSQAEGQGKHAAPSVLTTAARLVERAHCWRDRPQSRL